MDYSLLTEQKILEKYNGLSQDLKDVLSSASILVTIENIAQKYQLDEEKTTMLVQLVGLIILGFANPNDMKEEMKEFIEIDARFIPLIADEIRQKVFLPVINSLQKTPLATATAPTPVPATPTAPIMSAPRPMAPPPVPADRYREPMMGSPEVVDLRKAPAPIAPKPIPPKPVIPVPMPRPVAPPAVSPSTSPRPRVESRDNVEPPPLIEAEPHKVPVPAPLSGMPQVIIRPPGLPPTDRAHDILDLRKDRGEF